MELRLSLGPDEYGAAGKKMMSRERDVGLMEFHLGLGGRRPPEEVISSDPTSEDRSLPLLLPLLGGRRNLGEIADRSKEGTVSSAERKKLRLSKEQSSFLEQCFREHHTLTSSVKLDIAKQLNLRPRQVEVWFQNRRARTKLKHMEEDCSFLRRQCEWLTEENMRLQQELLRLRELNALPAVSDPPSSTTPESIPCTSCTHFRPTTTFARMD